MSTQVDNLWGLIDCPKVGGPAMRCGQDASEGGVGRHPFLKGRRCARGLELLPNRKHHHTPQTLVSWGVGSWTHLKGIGPDQFGTMPEQEQWHYP